MEKGTVTEFTVCACVCVEIIENRDREMGTGSDQ